MTLVARQLIKNKVWVVEADNGSEVASIIANESGATYIDKDQTRVSFPTMRLLKAHYNLRFDKPVTAETAKAVTKSVYGYPIDSEAYNILWNVKYKIPVYTKTPRSDCYFCAGYYGYRFPSGWARSFCPKLTSAENHHFIGPFKTLDELNQNLQIAKSKS